MGETYSVWGIFGSYTGAVEKEPNGGHLLSLTFAKSIHQLSQVGRALDLEEDFVVVIGHLDVKVLDRGGSCFLLGRFTGDPESVLFERMITMSFRLLTGV